MGFDKDWEIWESYKKGIEQIDNRDRVVKPLVRIYPKPQLRLPSFSITSPGASVRKLDKNEMKRFKSERFIDLHGRTREIDAALDTFCIECIMRDMRFITIITGKGSGILKEATTYWLKNHPELVIAYAPIMDMMNQSGSFAVKLRGKK